ncbi:UDP-glycosyltransferase UGT5-like [Adelges cooleyi]|uniref:UDP-glycosyltransferase UGT5-like n=1 Tax=Adelges cooleyi TaxID=133065 RepID=UPI00217FD0CB|nr:UDP-glycosyltransferase UGT5-like [Adelges cooleyi]
MLRVFKYVELCLYYALILALCVSRSSGDFGLSAKPSNILVFLPTESKSHFNGFKPLLQTLVSRGHNLTLVSPLPLDKAEYPYRHVQVEEHVYGKDSKPIADGNMLEVAKIINYIPAAVQICWFGPYISELTLNKSSVKDFITNDRSSFDLVIFENFFHESFVSIGHKYNAPVVQLLPFSTNARVSQWHSNPLHPAYITDVTSFFGSNMTFIQRTTNTLSVLAYTTVNRVIYLYKQNAVMNKYFIYPGHENRPDLATMLQNISLTLINSHPIIGSPVPLVPSYINVAGMHCKPAKELPQDLKKILDTSERGVVYFSLGSIVQSSKMPKETVSMLLSELSKIEQTVLWKWEADDLPQLPKNVIIRKWFPQNDILGHPNCRLFITHGGVHSTIESIYHGVPMLAIPVFGDQIGNSLRAQYRGIAIQVPFFELTDQAIGSALHRLLNDPRFAENAKRVSAIFRDQPLTPLETAIYWIEYVIRHKGAAHLKTAANELNWFQFLLLDVVLFVLSVVVLTVYTTKKILVLTFGLCCKRKASIEKKNQ